MKAYSALVDDPDHWVEMTFEAGDMQFVNNYHVLHGRREYVDDTESGESVGSNGCGSQPRSLAPRIDPTVPGRRGNAQLVGQTHQGVTPLTARVRDSLHPMSRFHDFTMASLEGEQVSFSDFADQACLIVNVASAEASRLSTQVCVRFIMTTTGSVSSASRATSSASRSPAPPKKSVPSSPTTTTSISRCSPRST